MKKIFLLVSFILSSVIVFANGGDEVKSTANAKKIEAPKGGPIDSGFGVKVTYSMYGGEIDMNAYGAEISNQWYFTKLLSNKLGVGVLVNWIDFTTGAKSEAGVDTRIIDMGIVEFGPVGTYAINDNMGVDLYATLRPTWFTSVVTSDIALSDATFTGLGRAYSVGTAFRFKMFYAGIEQNFGTIEAVSADLDDLTFDFNLTNTKLLLGFKF